MEKFAAILKKKGGARGPKKKKVKGEGLSSAMVKGREIIRRRSQPFREISGGGKCEKGRFGVSLGGKDYSARAMFRRGPGKLQRKRE